MAESQMKKFCGQFAYKNLSETAGHLNLCWINGKIEIFIQDDPTKPNQE